MKYINKEDSKDQVERFGMVVRSKDFFKKSEIVHDWFVDLIGKTAPADKKEEMMVKERKAYLKEKKAKGGRIGFKKGTGRTGVPAMDIKTKISLAKKKKKNQGDLGMQSVKYGLDKNPNVTAADPKAKFIAANKKNKKKVI